MVALRRHQRNFGTSKLNIAHYPVRTVQMGIPHIQNKP